ncbi:hypothetical protein E8E14_008027 [Neopestalotiopsis sp. 37M]|nr:hypothetical protein E8E14_008027 [Neopestalotiopsis sp. 37M]
MVRLSLPVLIALIAGASATGCGFKLAPCTNGEVCVPDSPDCTQVIGLCAGTCTAPITDGRPCGLRIAPCDAGDVCLPNDPSCTDPDRCLGQCYPLPTPTVKERKTPTPTYQACGGFVITPNPCPADYQCIDDPRKGGCGMACDAPGICVPNDYTPCSGFIGLSCPENSGLQCYDLPNDDCDPNNGGADCIGICLAPLKNQY